MSLQIVEKSGQGLSRVYGVTVPAATLLERLDQRISELRPQMNIKGFRPGKVPAAHVKRMYGKSLMSEIIDAAVNESQQQALTDANLRPAAQPEISVSSDIDKVLAGGVDLSFDLSVELMPEFETIGLDTIELTRPTHEATGEEIDEQLKEIAAQNVSYEPRSGKAVKAAEGDMVVGDFVGRIDGELFEGGSMENAEVVIGSGRFIPGFEDQLTGAKPQTNVTIGVTFPGDYGAASLAGKSAEFEFQVKEIRKPKETTIDDELAKTLGFEDLEKLKEAVKGSIESQHAQASRSKAKRALLDELDKGHSFDLPPKMVEGEFASIWQQVEAEKAAGELSDDDKEKTDEQLRAEYRKIAERRVRLGLVLAEIGRVNDVQVSDQELNQALIAEARRYPGQEQQVVEFYRQNANASAQLRAPIYEEKVVDLILEKAKVTEKKVSKEELYAEDEMPEGYGSEGAEVKAKAAPKKKSQVKKAAAKDKAED